MSLAGAAAEFCDATCCDDWIIPRRFGKLVPLKDPEIGGREEEGSVMRRSPSELLIPLRVALRGAGLRPARAPGSAARNPGRAACVQGSAAGSNFDRLSTLRHEVTVGPARVGQGTSSSARTSSLGQPQRASQPTSVKLQTTPHTFFPGMRGSQGPNKNVPQLRESYPGTARGLAPRHAHELRRSEDEFCPMLPARPPGERRRMPIRGTGSIRDIGRWGRYR